MAEPARVQLPPNIKPGSPEAAQFHSDLLNSLSQRILDHHVQNPGLMKGTGPHEGSYVRPVAPDVARQRYTAALTGQPHSALAHLGFEGNEPIPPELAASVAQSVPVPYQHAYEPDPEFNQMQSDYALAKLAPVAAQTAFQAAGGPAAVSYMQSTKKPNVSAFEKFKTAATDVQPILDAAQKLRQAEQGFGINSQQPSAYKGALNEFLGPPPAGAPQMTALPPTTPVAPPPANYTGGVQQGGFS